MNADSTRRFSSRVEDYVKYRPRYPRAVLDFMRGKLGLRPEHVMVDVGSGTGFLSELFLDAGYRVFGVEPNREMREAGEKVLAGQKGFTSVEGTAEATTLPSHLADFIVAGQAFHWFEPVTTKKEFHRILKPGGWVALIWNDRRVGGNPFLDAYSALLDTLGRDFAGVKSRRITSGDADKAAEFFAPARSNRAVVAGLVQDFDFTGLQGRLLSSSYAPQADQPGHEPMMAELRQVFQQHQQNGRVRFEYDTEIIYGQLA